MIPRRHTLDDNSLQQALSALVQSGSRANPAYDTLLGDYTLFHAVLAIEGGIFALLLGLLCWGCWRRLGQLRRAEAGRAAFEQWVVIGFGLASAVAALALVVVVAANLSNVLDPQAGFAQAIPELGTPHAGTRQAAIHREVAAWARSGAAAMPAALRDALRDRLAWQLPKAIVCSGLLAVAAALTAALWRRLIRRAAQATQWGPKAYAGIAAGVLAAPTTLLLMLMAMANTQASFAPITLTLLFG
ncbi:hypothetical protein F8S13_20575 [Chloroflexia bacterium SDU3-3]|nr:hypothetical protein F8S13_20575 [Chloroflexia bacterium SDU3-3]